MNREKILKLLESSNADDVLIGLNFLVGMERKQIHKFFEVREYWTIARLNVEMPQPFYKIAPDCVLCVSTNIFTTSYDNKPNECIDLTK